MSKMMGSENTERIIALFNRLHKVDAQGFARTMESVLAEGNLVTLRTKYPFLVKDLPTGQQITVRSLLTSILYYLTGNEMKYDVKEGYNMEKCVEGNEITLPVEEE
jgi:hypothetical protein